MRRKKIKIEKTLEPDQIAAFLRRLAAEIDGSGGEGFNDYGVDLHNFNKLKVGLVKKEGGQFHLELKIKDKKTSDAEYEPEVEAEDFGESSYKSFKKKLAKNFKSIGRAIEEQLLPPAELIETFMNEAEQLVSYPGFGDEYYDSFMKECRSFKDQYLQKNMEGLAGQYGRILSIMKDCHRRYK